MKKEDRKFIKISEEENQRFLTLQTTSQVLQEMVQVTAEKRNHLWQEIREKYKINEEVTQLKLNHRKRILEILKDC